MPFQLADERQRAERLATERDKAVSELAAARETLARKSNTGFSPTRRLSPRGTQPVGLISIAVDDLPLVSVFLMERERGQAGLMVSVHSV